MSKLCPRNAILFLLVTTCALLLAGCGNEDNKEQIATEVATRWVDTSIGVVSDTVAELVIGEESVLSQLAGGALAALISENLSWAYSEPVRESEDRYRVTVTATADFEVKIPPLIDKRYLVSVPFSLDVDTDAETVVSWAPDVRSAKIEEREE